MKRNEETKELCQHTIEQVLKVINECKITNQLNSSVSFFNGGVECAIKEIRKLKGVSK